MVFLGRRPRKGKAYFLGDSRKVVSLNVTETLVQKTLHQRMWLLADKCKPSIVTLFFCCKQQAEEIIKKKIIQVKAQIKLQKLNTKIILQHKKIKLQTICKSHY